MYYLRFLFFFVYFLVLSFRLFSLFPRFVVPSFSFFPRFVVPSLFIRKASRQQFVGFFPSIRLTLSPAMGRRPDYNIIFSVDINVTHVTRNSRLFAVTSTTCSTHTQSVSVPIHPIETDIYIHIANTRYEGYTYAVYSCVWRLWVVFLEHGGGGLLAFSCRQFALTIMDFSFPSKGSGQRMPPAERSALYLLIYLCCTRHSFVADAIWGVLFYQPVPK